VSTRPAKRDGRSRLSPPHSTHLDVLPKVDQCAVRLVVLGPPRPIHQHLAGHVEAPHRRLLGKVLDLCDVLVADGLGLAPVVVVQVREAAGDGEEHAHLGPGQLGLPGEHGARQAGVLQHAAPALERRGRGAGRVPDQRLFGGRRLGRRRRRGRRRPRGGWFCCHRGVRWRGSGCELTEWRGTAEFLKSPPSLKPGTYGGGVT
jgi:hypothetical protein